VSRFLTKIVSLLGGCRHDGLATPLRSFGGADIWRCEQCGGELVVVDVLL
jgi:hypothetical protein